MKYTVKYKLQGSWFWCTLKNVTGDMVAKDMPARVFFLEDGRRVEVPFGTAVNFSKERFFLVKKEMEQEAGQTIPTK